MVRAVLWLVVGCWWLCSTRGPDLHNCESFPCGAPFSPTLLLLFFSFFVGGGLGVFFSFRPDINIAQCPNCHRCFCGDCWDGMPVGADPTYCQNCTATAECTFVLSIVFYRFLSFSFASLSFDVFRLSYIACSLWDLTDIPVVSPSLPSPFAPPPQPRPSTWATTTGIRPCRLSTRRIPTRTPTTTFGRATLPPRTIRSTCSITMRRPWKTPTEPPPREVQWWVWRRSCCVL